MLTFDDLRSPQRGCIDFTYRGDDTLILADVGTGKTVIMLTVLQAWIKEGICQRALVVAPKRVCTDVWEQEFLEWEHLYASKHSIFRPICVAGCGTATRKQILNSPISSVVLINYERLPWLMEAYPDGPPGFNVLVMDEIDKLKDPTTLRFKGKSRFTDKKTQQQRVIPGAKDYRDNFEIHVGMTGTPVSNHLLDLWAQVYMIDGGERLGDNYYDFRNRHFYQDDWAGYKYAVLPGREDWIYDQIKDITFRIEKFADMPPVVELPIRFVEQPKKARAIYKEMQREYIVYLERVVAGDKKIDKVEAEHAAILYGKLRQMSAGFAYVGDQRSTFTEWFTKVKFDELDNLISELQGQQLLIVYHYQAQLTELKRRYAHIAILGGDVSDSSASKTIQLWNGGRLPLLALHPASAGHGLNLQKSGAHHIVLLTEPESAGLYEQVIGRLARTGNPASTVFVHRILMAGTQDEDQDLVVHSKIQGQAAMLKSMRERMG